MSTGQADLVENNVKCYNCETCKPGDCIKRYIENNKIKYFDGIGNCGKCINCVNSKKYCINPSDKKNF